MYTYLVLERILLINYDENVDREKLDLIKSILDPELGYKIEYFNGDSNDPIDMFNQVWGEFFYS